MLFEKGDILLTYHNNSGPDIWQTNILTFLGMKGAIWKEGSLNSEIFRASHTF